MPDRSQGGGVEAIDTRRYLAAVRRDLPLIAALAIGLTIFAVALSMVLPKTYSATAKVGFDLTSSGITDSASQERYINTQVVLVTANRVLTAAQRLLVTRNNITTDTATLLADTTAVGAFGENVLNITVKTDDPTKAAAFANAVSDAFINATTSTQASSLQSRIDTLAQLVKTTSDEQLKAQYEQNLSELIGQKSQQQQQVQNASAAVVPGGPDSPKPIRNGVLAFAVGIFLGVLLALLRDQARPRFTTTRDLGQFLEVPVVAAIPELGRRLGRTAPQAMRVEQEAYQSLSAALRLALPPSQTHVIMLTSSMHAEGKTTVATRVARLLAGSGHRTLLVSGDLRWPRLDALVHVEGRPGFSDLLAAESATPGGVTAQQLQAAIMQGDNRDRTAGGADVLPSGTLANDAARLLSGGALEPLIEKLRRLGYTYIIVDATPLLGLADAKLIARACDRVLVVGRLERISVPAALDLRDELGRIGVPILGLVAIGGNTEASPYYSGVKFVPSSEPTERQRANRE